MPKTAAQQNKISGGGIGGLGNLLKNKMTSSTTTTSIAKGLNGYGYDPVDVKVAMKKFLVRIYLFICY